MTKRAFDDAVSEAKRFLRIASVIEFTEYGDCHDKKHYAPVTGKRTGQLKRSSMDLTRALAEMRKPFGESR